MFGKKSLYDDAVQWCGRTKGNIKIPISAKDLSKAGDADNTVIAVYENGFITGTLPPISSKLLYDYRQVYYSSRYIMSDGVVYDLYDTETVIKPMRFDNSHSAIEGVTSDIIYVLRMKAAKMLDTPRLLQAGANLLKQVTKLMPVCGIAWQEKEYMRTPEQLYAHGLFKDGDEYATLCRGYAEAAYKAVLPRITPKGIVTTHKHDKSDLISSFGASACCCGICAKYRQRVFSYSGKDKRFPRLPDELKNDTYFIEHKHCGLTFVYFFDGISSIAFNVNGTAVKDMRGLIAVSNRLFVDDRSADEIEAYNDKIIKQSYDYLFAKYKQLGVSYVEYMRLIELLPDECPQDIASYRKMKKQNTKAYQALKQRAVACGLVLQD